MEDYDYEDEEADEEVEDIRTLDTKKEMVRIRAEKKLTLARVKRLLRESEDLLEFDIDAEQFHSNEIQKGCDYLMGMHLEIARARDHELQYLSSWIMSRVKTANDDKEEMKERKDEQKDAKEDTLGPVYERQMHFKSSTNRTASEMLVECHKNIEWLKAREKHIIKEMKDTYETHLSNAALRFEKLDIAYKSLVKVNATLKETLIECEHERDAWQRQFMAEQEINDNLIAEKTGKKHKRPPPSEAQLEYKNAIKKLRDAAEAKEQEFEDMTRQCAEKQEILDGLIKELKETKETLDDSNKKAGDLLLQLARSKN